MFRRYVVPEKLNEPVERLAVEYQATLNHTIFATIFYKVFKLAVTISHEYYGLTAEDIASWSVEKLEYCLRTFKAEENGKFSTYYGAVLRNKFKEETVALTMQKRKVHMYTDSLDKAVELGFDTPAPTIDDMWLNIETDSNLTPREKQFCYLVINRYSSLEIAETLGVSQMTLTNIRKQLRVKIR
ncbi:helix-turn-helix transcriptional regulator [Bacteroides sp.]|uniref:helix-turn-helix transcriptional regulator n=1 Tax=Bacteroides sp. TaxID=29523 RepID=UPI0026270E93|nr:helix-turn-helix transcriptional regulator [Bacteroides sp.]MDD3039728.1 helix-turn-helix transcriptional regulator [Bacteroides sp.]